MSELTLILLAAGESNRFKLPVKKQWLRVDHDPLWHFVTKKLFETGKFKKIIITAHKDEVTFMHNFSDFEIIEGGSTRQESLKNALKYVDSDYVLVSDIARACISDDLLEKIVSSYSKADSIVPYLNVSDTITYNNETIERENVKRIQTPQLSKTEILIRALNSAQEFTDESSAIVAIGGSREFVDGSEDAHKITFVSDLNKIPCLSAPSSDILTGNGFDVHEFENGKKMFLGGVEIENSFGFKAHSDGDVAIHALIDALLGAAGMGDIGMLFPDSDNQYKDIDSKKLLEITVDKLTQFGYIIINSDITIIAQTPRLLNYKEKMKNTLSKIMKIPKSRVNIKATTTEKLGFIGREEGVAVMVNATLKYFNWKEI